MPNYVQQSGQVTPAHLASWTTNGVLQDSGIILSNTYGGFQSVAREINFNQINYDNPIAIGLPPTFTRYYISSVILSGATAPANSATFGLFTEESAAGIQVVASGTACTITESSVDTNENMQALVNNQNTLALSDLILYFRLQAAQGSACLVNVSIFYIPLP